MSRTRLWLCGMALVCACDCLPVDAFDDVGADVSPNEDATVGNSDRGVIIPDAQIVDGQVVVPDAIVIVDGQVAPPADCNAECCDGIDNDNDGQIDGFDSECIGAYDNDEGSFATGIPGDNMDPVWQDCFYDGNSGAGDDGCRFHSDCLTGETDRDCSLTQECIDFCAPRTPNGCDCFGCCEVQAGDLTRFVRIVEGCSDENLADEDACPACVPTTDCNNECGRCEICVGQTAAQLPADCFQQPAPDAGVPNPGCGSLTPCAAQADCPDTDYCFQGCCQPNLI